MSDDSERDVTKPAKPTLVTFRGGPHDGTVHTDDACDPNVLIARFIAFVYEDKGEVDVLGNSNVGSPVAHRYRLVSAQEHDGLRTLVVDYVSQATG